MKISSPVVNGSGAYIVHKILSENINKYTACPYNPLWTLLPPKLCKAIKYPDADIIHTTPDHPLWMNQPEKPLVLTFHNYVLDNYMKKRANYLQRIYYSTLVKKYTIQSVNHAHKITAVSKFTAELVKEDLGLNKEIEVIYNGIDSNKFIPQKTISHDKCINVLFVGNFTHRKGAHLLTKISNKLGNNINIYCTRGLRKNKYISNANNLIDVGHISYDDMPALYNKADIFLFPTFREGFGLAVAEAMSCGLPVVASNCSSIPELLDDGKGGFLCPVGEIDAFVEKIELLVNAPELRHEMGEYNRVKVEEKFTIGQMVEGYKALFEEVLSI